MSENPQYVATHSHVHILEMADAIKIKKIM